ncbi:alkanesulfonate monooxygenase SsuD/methylene tetrahydromethanopterin reductase-like flavin-dependent oxidoreductase (luciferase family) [Kribbella sp. VKM Ac-2527]|uniref:Alkanesulfonate monooxygenase SsuD/methylene tetrahydromethanopterin reductase-like flavin-dependent oxidoreductase (Luciferase family) n=1 Tax=Kribbella caucasensis TaxID=2512215 RepID=A0A4R6KAA2_9ACTN|nr:LLM class flavin-dependent oxidoreductase [Kribbella sp. VKM Ac-2527]TDO46864.1 alkanesulfonate monooxygenase SsuD/methylene tetrahydromethanopterin reductase-like flavin-dependent oxidoreductase (luciferase family) [Kribbella sp. VKM Ac-2527]
MKVGVAVNEDLLIPDPAARRRLLDHIAEVGLDHVTTGDHISFHGGAGFDGLVSATSILTAHDGLDVVVGVYLAALRHPMLIARQLSTISQLAPGRLVLGVGVGGEDRSEVSNAGVDPATRGRRLDETLELLRRLADGETVDHDGRFFSLRKASILPVPDPPVPLVVGGSGDVAVRRTARYGDGWLGLFCSARRFADTVERIRAATADLGRPAPSWFGLNMWCGLGLDAARAQDLLGRRLEALYNLPAEKFEHVTASGTPEMVATKLAPYVAAGAEHLTLIIAAGDVHEGVDLAAEVHRLLVSG